MARIRSIKPDDPATWDDLVPCGLGHELLYRFRDAAGGLLYIGITWTPRERWRKHRARASWWPRVREVALECYPNEFLALKAELAAIHTEDPMFNKRGVVRHGA